MFSSSAWSISSSAKEFNRESKKQRVYVYDEDVIRDEAEWKSIWESILKRKGLPLDTPYEFDGKLADKAYDESFCDMLYLEIQEKKNNPEAAAAAKSWLPPPAPPSPDFSSSSFTYVNYLDDREFDKQYTHDVNGIVYPHGSEAARKRYFLSKEYWKKADERFKQRQAEGLVPLGLFRPPMLLDPLYEEQEQQE